MKKLNARWKGILPILGNIGSRHHQSGDEKKTQKSNLAEREMFGIGTGGLVNERKSGDNQNYSLDEIGQNTEKIPGDLRRLAVT